MGSAIRKIERRAAIANRRQAQRALNDAEGLLGRMRKSCTSCNSSFDAKTPSALDTWRISIREGNAHLTCPECWAKISSAPGVQ